MIDGILLNHLLLGLDEMSFLWSYCSFCTILLLFFSSTGHHLTDASYIPHKGKATLRDWQSNQAALWFTRPSTCLSEQLEKGAETEHVVHPLHSTFPTYIHTIMHTDIHTPFWSLAFFLLTSTVLNLLTIPAAMEQWSAQCCRHRMLMQVWLVWTL